MRLKVRLTVLGLAAILSTMMLAGTSSAGPEWPSWRQHSAKAPGCYDQFGAEMWASSSVYVAVSDRCTDGYRARGTVEKYVSGRWVVIATVEDTYNDDNTREYDLRGRFAAGQSVRMRACTFNADTGKVVHCGYYKQWTAT